MPPEDEAPTAHGPDGTAQVVTPPPEATEIREEPERTRRPAPKPRVRVKPLEARLHEFFGKIEPLKGTEGHYFTGIAGMVSMFNYQDGTIIAMNSENMAKAWANLAQNNERVKRYLEWMLSGGAWGEVFVATSPVILAIMMNHGISPQRLFGPIEVDHEPTEGTGPDIGAEGGSMGRVPPGI